jgi:hypothetical protein
VPRFVPWCLRGSSFSSPLWRERARGVEPGKRLGRRHGADLGEAPAGEAREEQDAWPQLVAL